LRLVAATPNSSPLPESYRALFNSISQDYLRDTVKQIAVPRAYGTSENEAVLSGLRSPLDSPQHVILLPLMMVSLWDLLMGPVEGRTPRTACTLSKPTITL